MKKIIFGIFDSTKLIILFLVLFNLFQIYRTAEFSILYKRYKQLLWTEEFEWEISGRRLNEILVFGVRDGMRLLEGQTILFFIHHKSCLNCLRDEIFEINRLISKDAMPKFVGVFLFSESLSERDSLNFLNSVLNVKPSFPIYFCYDTTAIFDDVRLEVSIILLINEDREVVLAYVPEPNNDLKRKSFYRLISYLLGQKGYF